MSVPFHLLEHFGGDLLGFKRAAESLGGKTKDLTDPAHKISAFPKVPLFYLFWEGDDEEIASKVSRCGGWGRASTLPFSILFRMNSGIPHPSHLEKSPCSRKRIGSPKILTVEDWRFSLTLVHPPTDVFCLIDVKTFFR